MEQFISWGGLTPEESRKKFQKQVEEYRAYRAMMEARAGNTQSGSTGTAAAGVAVGKGAPNAPFTETTVIAYRDAETGTHQFFAADSLNSKFSRTTDTGLSFDTWQLWGRYVLQESGYALVFYSNNIYKIFLLDKFANTVEIREVGPTTDVIINCANGRLFFAIDPDANTMFTFDGTVITEHNDIFGAGFQYVEPAHVNANSTYWDNTSSLNGMVLVFTNSVEEGVTHRRIVKFTATESFEILNVILDEQQTTDAVPVVGSYSNVILVQRLDTTDGSALKSLEAYDDTTGTLLGYFSFDSAAGGNVSIDYIEFHGLAGGSLGVFWREAMKYFVFFDPILNSFSYIDINTNDYPNVHSYYTLASNVWTYTNNQPVTDTAAFTVYDNPNWQDFNMGTAACLVITKFLGEAPRVSSLPNANGGYAFNGIQYNQNVVLMPYINDSVLYIAKAFAGNEDDQFITNLPEMSCPTTNLTDFWFETVGPNFIFSFEIGAYDDNLGNANIFYSDQYGNVDMNTGYYLITEHIQYDGINWDYYTNGPFAYLYDWTNGVNMVAFPEAGSWVQVDPYFYTQFNQPERYLTENLQRPPIVAQYRDTDRMFWFTDRGNGQNPNNFISDGGNDMYDSGNYMSTNLAEDAIHYTHTQANEGEELQNVSDFAMDGVVVDNSNWFGDGSSYFTNLYPGFFVLAATNISIDEFSLDGDNGADSEGQLAGGTVRLNTDYVLLYKKIWSAEDPSINQLIIVKAATNPTLDYSNDTNNTYHKVSNLAGVEATELHYLLFAKANGMTFTEAELITIANDYLATISSGNGNANDYLTLLNANYGRVTASMPRHNPNSFVIRKMDPIDYHEITVNGYSMNDVIDITFSLGGIIASIRDSRRNNRITFLFYDADGVLKQTVETDNDQILNNWPIVSKNRFMALTYNEADEVRTYEANIFGNRGRRTKKTFTATEVQYLLNDIAWWYW